jgi:hypothetical protein
MAMADDPEKETYTEAETEARREAALKRMLATPHKPHTNLNATGAPRFNSRRRKVVPEDLG